MTSGELLNKRFEKTHMGGGYRPAEVEAFLAEAATAFAQLTRENGELKRQVEALRAQTADVEADKNSLRDALLSAQKFADGLVADSRKKADALLSEARTKADTLASGAQLQVTQQKEELTRIKTEVASFRSKLLDLYRAHLELIGAIPAEQADGEPAARQDGERTSAAQPAQPPVEEAALAAAPPAHEANVGANCVRPNEEPPAHEAAQEQLAKPQPAAPEREAAAAAEPGTVDPKATEPKAAEPPQRPTPQKSAPKVRLNMRFDAKTGEYIPIPDDRAEEP